MHKKQIVFLIFWGFSLCVFGQRSSVTVFSAGTGGYASYRIPAIIRLPGNDLLAFAEGRVQSAADFGHVNIVMKRSSDKGKSWGPLKVVATYKSLQAGNPAPVVDLTDPKYPTGRVFLFFNTGEVPEGEVRHGKGIRETAYITSVDQGNSWTQPVNITAQVNKILHPDLNPAWNHPEDWRSYANTPGHGLQIKTGAFKGRIFIAANHSEGQPKKDFSDYVAHGFYSDDHGKSFQLSQNIPAAGSNESTTAELSGGKIMFNSRNQKADVRERIVGLSSDGGTHWDTTYFDHQLPDPVCEGSLLTLRYGKVHNVLAFCNNASQQNRDSLTLRISEDDGQNWKQSFLIEKQNSGYSDIIDVSPREIGVFYEAQGYQKIEFTLIKWNP